MERLVDYTTEYYGTMHPEWIAKTLAEKDYWNHVYDERYEALEKLVGGVGRIFDIGCFIGMFLQRGKDRGWLINGVEPSEQAWQYCFDHSIPCWRGYFEDVPEGDGMYLYDAVNMSLTLEHLHNPELVLAKVYRILQPDGVLLIEVPNDFSPMQDAVCKALNKKRYWEYPEHTGYYNFNSLYGLLLGAGFEVVHRTATFPMEWFLMMGDDYIGNDAVGRECHKKRMNWELNMDKGGLKEFRQKLYQFLAEQGIGRELVVYAQKR